MVFIELPLFGKYVEFDDTELWAIQQAIFHNPECGDLIQGAHGLRMMRAAVRGRGKRGGARVIYYLWDREDRCYLVFTYLKTQMEDLTAKQLKAMVNVMSEEFGK